MTTGICPFAIQHLLPEAKTQPAITPRLAILHSAAGRGSLGRFFATGSNLESHFWVGGDGTIEQYMPTTVRADANLNANGFAVSIETESSRAATEPWSPAQVAAIVRLLRWICDEHRIPPRVTPTWDGHGIGWHIQFGAPGPWTPVAKSCPGPARIAQVPDIIADVLGQPAPAPTGDLTMGQYEDLKAEIAAERKRTDTISAKLGKLELGGYAKDTEQDRRLTVAEGKVAIAVQWVKDRLTPAKG